MRRYLIPLFIVTVGLTTACGSSDSSSPSNSESSIAPTEDFNDDDVMFAQMMIPHHEQAIEMADMALDPTIGASQAVKDLATQIKAAQDPEIMEMKNLLTTWGASLEMSGDMDHSSGMDGMLTTDEMSELSTSTGTDFDQAWISGMIAHHEGAIDMADEVLSQGKNTATSALAQAIISAQQQEISTLQDLLN